MATQSISTLAAGLNYLNASPQKLLVLGCLLYLRGKPRTYVFNMRGGFAIFQGWCKDHPSWSKFADLNNLAKPNFNVQQLVPGYEINRIGMFLQLPNYIIEAAFAEAIRMIACQQSKKT